MDAQPPNDPNRNNNNNNHHNPNPSAAKEAPYDGRDNTNNDENQPMDIIGADLRDSPVVVVMFLIGVASWLLRERCVC
eukprot:CAMPEP_0119563124 /NCGR_PEP_ID=MMETSP1352-20130426/22521_1 /TAXON_ID=265584 /ORGANISM="Stauroneis constricta, Strain CCMP1120" /LENGTH=77 /DNA_ID=CAMNT_0007611665 /DNA_START=54 /DNA_END=287 /DNA_ORIENTATION=-